MFETGREGEIILTGLALEFRIHELPRELGKKTFLAWGVQQLEPALRFSWRSHGFLFPKMPSLWTGIADKLLSLNREKLD